MIAANMVKSATLIPQAWSEVAVDVTGMVARRQSIKRSFMSKEGAGGLGKVQKVQKSSIF